MYSIRVTRHSDGAEWQLGHDYNFDTFDGAFGEVDYLTASYGHRCSFTVVPSQEPKR